jgi:coenzyme PQQ precursor peptide PqqA
MAPSTWTKPEYQDLNLSAEIGMYYEDGDGLLELDRAQSDALHLRDPASEPTEPSGRA